MWYDRKNASCKDEVERMSCVDVTVVAWTRIRSITGTLMSLGFRLAAQIQIFSQSRLKPDCSFVVCERAQILSNEIFAKRILTTQQGKVACKS